MPKTIYQTDGPNSPRRVEVKEYAHPEGERGAIHYLENGKEIKGDEFLEYMVPDGLEDRKKHQEEHAEEAKEWARREKEGRLINDHGRLLDAQGNLAFPKRGERLRQRVGDLASKGAEGAKNGVDKLRNLSADSRQSLAAAWEANQMDEVRKILDREGISLEEVLAEEENGKTKSLETSGSPKTGPAIVHTKRGAVRGVVKGPSKKYSNGRRNSQLYYEVEVELEDGKKVIWDNVNSKNVEFLDGSEDETKKNGAVKPESQNNKNRVKVGDKLVNKTSNVKYEVKDIHGKEGEEQVSLAPLEGAGSGFDISKKDLENELGKGNLWERLQNSDRSSEKARKPVLTGTRTDGTKFKLFPDKNGGSAYKLDDPEGYPVSEETIEIEYIPYLDDRSRKALGLEPLNKKGQNERDEKASDAQSFKEKALKPETILELQEKSEERLEKKMAEWSDMMDVDREAPTEEEEYYMSRVADHEVVNEYLKNAPEGADKEALRKAMLEQMARAPKELEAEAQNAGGADKEKAMQEGIAAIIAMAVAGDMAGVKKKAEELQKLAEAAVEEKEISDKEAHETVEKHKRSRWARAWDWIRHPGRRSHIALINRDIENLPDGGPEPTSSGRRITVTEEESATPERRERRSAAAFAAGALATAGAGLLAYFLMRHGQSSEVINQFISGHGVGNANIIHDAHNFSANAAGHDVVASVVGHAEHAQHAQSVLESLKPDTIYAHTPDEFHRGVLKLLHEQGIQVNQITPDRLHHMTQWMQTNEQIASGMKEGAHGLEQNVVNFPSKGQHFVNADMSTVVNGHVHGPSEGFTLGPDNTGKQQLIEYAKEAQRIGLISIG